MNTRHYKKSLIKTITNSFSRHYSRTTQVSLFQNQPGASYFRTTHSYFETTKVSLISGSPMCFLFQDSKTCRVLFHDYPSESTTDSQQTSTIHCQSWR